MNVLSTRNSEIRIPATKAVIMGISEDGGLFVPERFTPLDLDSLIKTGKSGYAALCAKILGVFFDIPQNELLELTEEAYKSFDTEEVVPLQKLSEKEYVMELFHGPTLAFKDMALQVLPRLLTKSLYLHHQKEDILVLTATSGDTGKAALEGFKDVPRTAIVVFYPQDGVADMQKLQMVTQDGSNTGVYAVGGNFDDAQTGVKKLFASKEFRDEVRGYGYSLSSANSINIGRLAPQVAYYVYSYIRLVETGAVQKGDPVNFVVPTGNFGNILAAYYAKRMGLPVGRLVCASNQNNVLTDFFNEGNYDAKRTFYKTMSPSMDILISSNLERLLFEVADRDDAVVIEWMHALRKRGEYKIPQEIQTELKDGFYADCASEEMTARAIRDTFERHGYLMDPHTAVAQAVYSEYTQKTGDDTVSVVVSTANPYKFTQDVLFSLTGERTEDAFLAADRLSALTKTKIPPQIGKLKEKPVLHDQTFEKEALNKAVLGFLKDKQK
ncbi:MAG: threonine synthase [Christensenellaceae bacterium]|jgi:threonine synthase